MYLKFLLPAFIMLFFVSQLPVWEEIEGDDGIENSTHTYREWQRLGYDDLCTYFYPRPSPTYLPPEKPYEPLIKTALPDSPLISPWQTTFTGNLDNDTALEIVVLGNNTLYAIDDTGELLWVRPHPPRSNLGCVGDADGDGRAEIFVGIKGTNESQARLEVFNFLGKIVKSIAIEGYDGGVPGHVRDGYYDGSPTVSALKDLNGDGMVELYVELHASYDLYPRGLLCIDYSTGEVMWSFIEATHITNIIFPDLNGDGRREIVFGTSASKNGAICPLTYTNDFTSYVFALTSDGKELWRYEIGRGFYHTMVASADINGDGELEVICYLGDKVPEERTDFGRLRVLSSSGELVREYRTPYLWLKPAGIYDIDSDGTLEAIVQAQNTEEEVDHLIIMNLSSGEIERDAEVPTTEGKDITFVPGGINDINGDGKVEIVVSPMIGARVLVYDSKLNLLWSYGGVKAPGMALISDVIPGGVNEIVLTGNHLTVLSLNVDVEVERESPEETTYVIEGRSVKFTAKILNTGNVTWVMEVSLLQDAGEELNCLKSWMLKTPPPGGSDTISFDWVAPGEWDEVTLHLQVNLTYYSGGIERVGRRVSWRVRILRSEALDSLIELRFSSPKKVNPGKEFTVEGHVELNLTSKGWDERRVSTLLPPATITLIFFEQNYTTSIGMGESFETTFISPERGGSYPIILRLCIPRLGTLERRSTVEVTSPRLLGAGSGVGVFLPGAAALLGAAYLGKHLLKRRTFPFIPLYRRDYEHPISDHKMRERIYTLIKEHPGINPSEICKKLGIAHYNTVKHHLRVLRDREQIVLKRDPVKRRFITCYPTDKNYEELGYLSDAERYLLEVIKRSPGITRKELTELWPYSQAYLTRCLKSLQVRGAVIKEGRRYRRRGI